MVDVYMVDDINLMIQTESLQTLYNNKKIYNGEDKLSTFSYSYGGKVDRLKVGRFYEFGAY